jgi:D-3-phosphoglycerate dehydrogenase
MRSIILTYNNIAVAGLRQFPRERFEVTTEASRPDAIIVRSYNLHDMTIPDSVAAIGRAGAGVNNIPIDRMTSRGVPVFNAPGANANAVKELVIAGLLVAARNICAAWNYVRNYEGSEAEFQTTIEAAKKKFVGFELPGRTLGVIGLGAIGVKVANAAHSLGMNVIGFDPKLTVQSAWQLSSGVAQAQTLDELFTRSDAVTLHVPLVDATHKLVNRDRLALMKPGGILLNFSRGGVVDAEAVIELLDKGHLGNYVCDFPVYGLADNDKVIALPHLGASTTEAEENCAAMVSANVRDYLENGNIKNSVNFPDAYMPRDNAYRITVANANVPNMVGQISTCLANANLNIADLLNKSQGDIAYTVVDLDAEVPAEIVEQLRNIKGVLSLRYLGRSPAGDGESRPGIAT